MSKFNKHIRNGVIKLYEQTTVEGLDKSLSDTCNGWTTAKGETRPCCPLKGKCNPFACEVYREHLKLSMLLKNNKEVNSNEKV